MLSARCPLFLESAMGAKPSSVDGQSEESQIDHSFGVWEKHP